MKHIFKYLYYKKRIYIISNLHKNNAHFFRLIRPYNFVLKLNYAKCIPTKTITNDSSKTSLSRQRLVYSIKK